MNNRRPMIAGNWKMNLNLAESVALAKDHSQGNGRSERGGCARGTRLSQPLRR